LPSILYCLQLQQTIDNDKFKVFQIYLENVFYLIRRSGWK